jgi:Putative Ig domain
MLSCAWLAGCNQGPPGDTASVADTTGGDTTIATPSPPSGSPNSAPTISGTPPGAAMQGQLYSYTPTANDAEGDTLTFSVQNPPSWATFDSMTGQLSGTPGLGDVGVYSDIRISVSDNQATASVGPFEITVVATALGSATLSWQPPTQNTDGSPLTDLAGYKVHWGTSPNSYANVEVINNPGITSYVVGNLTPNTYYFVATAFDSLGLESTYSNMASKTIR